MRSKANPPRDRWLRDGKARGIYYRVRSGGTKTWGYYSCQSGGIVRADGDRQAALDAQAQDRLRRSAGLPAPDRKTTVGQLADELRDSKRARLKASTFREWERVLDTVILPEFGFLRPAEVTPDRVAGFIRSLEQRNLARTTITSYLKPLTAILELALRRAMITQSPVALLTSDERPQASPRKRWYEWSPETIQAVLDAARELDARPEARAAYHPLIATLVYTGARIGEALALRWEDVDLLEGLIRVRHTWSRDGVATSPKTTTATREIPIADALVNTLALAKPEDATDSDFVFAARHGNGPISYWNVRSRGFAQVVACAGLADQGVTIHDLRHAAASLWIWAGLTAVEVAALLGHRNATTTLSIYAHLFDRSDAYARARTAFAVLEAGRT